MKANIKEFYLIRLIVLIVLISFNSCDLSVDVKGTTSSIDCLPDPTIKDGKMVFSSMEVWKKSMEAINENNIQRFYENCKKKNFISHFGQRFYEGNLNISHRSDGQRLSDIDSIRYSDIIDPKLASVLNQNQQIQIANKVYQFQNDFTFVYLPIDSVQIDNFYADLKANIITSPQGNNSIDYHELTVYKTTVELTHAPYNSGRTESYEGEYKFDDTHRLFGRIYTYWTFFYSSAGIETYVQEQRKKCTGKWFWKSCWSSWDNPLVLPNSGDIRMKCDIWIFFDGAPAAHFVKSLSNYNSANLFMGEIYGFNVKRFELHGRVCHSATYKGREGSVYHPFTNFITYWNFPVTNLTCP